MFLGYKDTFKFNIYQDIALFEKYTKIKGLNYLLQKILIWYYKNYGHYIKKFRQYNLFSDCKWKKIYNYKYVSFKIIPTIKFYSGKYYIFLIIR